MIIVLQRVTEATVYSGGRLLGRIGAGLLAYVAVDRTDLDNEGGLRQAPIKRLAEKTVRMRLFRDGSDSHFVCSLEQVQGSVLVVSQFTLPGRTRKGTRPSFERAADPAIARAGYYLYCQELQALGVSVQTGEFAADMQVTSTNDGPVTLMLGTSEAETPWAA